MVGNLHEWIEDPDGTFKGGFYVDAERNGPGCLYTTTAHAGTYRDYWVYVPKQYDPAKPACVYVNLACALMDLAAKRMD